MVINNEEFQKHLIARIDTLVSTSLKDSGIPVNHTKCMVFEQEKDEDAWDETNLSSLTEWKVSTHGVGYQLSYHDVEKRPAEMPLF